MLLYFIQSAKQYIYEFRILLWVNPTHRQNKYILIESVAKFNFIRTSRKGLIKN